LYNELVSVLQKTHPIITEVQFLIATLDRQTNACVTFIGDEAPKFLLNDRLVYTSPINPSWENAPKSISALDFIKIAIHELGHAISDVNEHHGKQWQSNCIALARLLGIELKNPSTFCDSQEKRDVMGGFAGYFGCDCCRYFRDKRPSKQQMSKNKRTCGKCKVPFKWCPAILDKRNVNEDTAPPEGKDSFSEMFKDLFGDSDSTDEEPIDNSSSGDSRSPAVVEQSPDRNENVSSDKEPTLDMRRGIKRPHPSTVAEQLPDPKQYDSTDKEPIGNRLKNSNPPIMVEVVNSSSGDSRSPSVVEQSPNPKNTHTYTLQSERKDKEDGVIYQETHGKSKGKLRAAWARKHPYLRQPVFVNITAGKQGVCNGSVIEFHISPSDDFEFIVEDAKVKSNGDVHCFLRCYHDDNGTPSAPPSEKPTYMSARCNGNITFGASRKRAHERFVLRKK